ncbi:hypothetical protein NL676_005562 [Syzygium grande]|nr:hypothetical protein NL676_005562 [Syzygium grande]
MVTVVVIGYGHRHLLAIEQNPPIGESQPRLDSPVASPPWCSRRFAYRCYLAIVIRTRRHSSARVAADLTYPNAEPDLSA